MQAVFKVSTPGAKDEFDCYAEGVIKGLKLGAAQVTTAGVGGGPGPGTFVGALQGGPIVMAAIVATNALGVIPPSPEGSPTPLQVIWHLAIAQIATHVLVALQVDAPASDSVAAGVGIIAPGGFSVSGALIAQLIILAYLKKGLVATPYRIKVAKVVGNSTQQMMALATMVIPIVGGSPSNFGSAGVRVGKIS